MHQRKQFYLRRQQLIQLRQVQCAVIPRYRNVRHLRPRALRQQLPRHDVAVMLHLREQHHIARLQILHAPRGRHQVNAFRGAPRKNDFLRARRIDELGRARAGGFKTGRGAIAQFMNAPVDVRIVVLVIMHQRVNDLARLLRRGGVVQIDQRLAVNLLVQYRKILPQGLPVGDGAHRVIRLNKSCRDGETGFATAGSHKILNQSRPSCSFAASVIMLWFHGGSQTSSTFASSIGSSEINLFCTSCASTGPMPQPGAVRVILTSAL